MQGFVIINNIGMMINVGVNVKNWLIKEYVMKDLFGIPSYCECESDKSCDVGNI